MGAKPSYAELERRIQVLEKEVAANRELKKALRDSEERYIELFEHANDMIQTLDPDGRFLEVNQKWRETFGYDEDELAALTLWDVIHPDSVAYCREVFQRVFSGETVPNIETLFIPKRGEPIPMEGSIYCHMERGKPKTMRGIFRSISKWKQSEEALKQSEEALRRSEEIARTLLTANTDSAFLTDLYGVVIATNHFAALRVGKKMHEFIGQCAWDFLPSELSDATKALVNEVVRSGKPVNYEEEFLDHVFYNSLYPVFDIGGKVERLAFFARDITHLKKAEQALQESEKRYRSVFENSGTAMAILEKDMIISMANSEYEKLTGYSKEQLEGKLQWTEFVAKEDLEIMKRYHAQRRQGDESPPTGYEFRLVDSKGCMKNIFLKVDMIPGTDRSIASLLDITSRKKAEQALRESEEKYRLLVENANDAILIAQDQGIKFHNPKTEVLTGYSSEELVKIPFIDLIHPEDRELVFERHLKRIEGENLISTYPFRILNREGDELWVDLSTVLITWEGKPATLNFIRDITLQKRIEAQLLQARKMEAVGTLAGGIAHDFNNLLMGIQGNASLMLLNTDTRQPHYEKLKNIEEYVQNGADLTKQLLGFARGGKYEVKPTNLSETVNKSAEMFGRTKKEIVILKKYEQEIWPAEVDQRQIEQVLLNLYVNAWQAMPAGGEMYLETKNVVLHDHDVEPYGVKPGRYVKISVTDTGVGMDETTRARIFDPFFTTKEMGRGTGLGLASAYGIINSHGGIIQVFSQKGQGTEFDIYLPASEKQIMERRKPPEEVLKGKGTILFIDDEAMVIDVVKQMLHSLGYNVLAAKGGAEALKMYGENKDQISMVILDMVMPGLSGGETYDRLKEVNHGIKVLLSSGYSIDGQAAEILDRGCHGFIQKPFNLKDLAKKIREILDQD